MRGICPVDSPRSPDPSQDAPRRALASQCAFTATADLLQTAILGAVRTARPAKDDALRKGREGPGFPEEEDARSGCTGQTRPHLAPPRPAHLRATGDARAAMVRALGRTETTSSAMRQPGRLTRNVSGRLGGAGSALRSFAKRQSRRVRAERCSPARFDSPPARADALSPLPLVSVPSACRRATPEALGGLEVARR